MHSFFLIENRPLSGNNFVVVATPPKGYNNTLANGPSSQTWQRPPSQPSKDVIKKPVIFVIGKAHF